MKIKLILDCCAMQVVLFFYQISFEFMHLRVHLTLELSSASIDAFSFSKLVTWSMEYISYWNFFTFIFS